MKKNKLIRQMGLMLITATGICSMMGASINVIPFMIQKNVPGIGPYVVPAFLFAAIPAVFAAFAYAILSSAMPRAGGSYLYASRGLNPYLGFIASFSQWFGLSIVIGVISYIIVPFIRDIFFNLEFLEIGSIRLIISLLFIWLFVYVNIIGGKLYRNTLIPMLIIMFSLGSIVIISGLLFDQNDFIDSVYKIESRVIEPVLDKSFDWKIFLTASTLMFSSFIGFDAIAQTGNEAKNPTKNIPKAILLAISIVSLYYILFTISVYNIIPWNFVADEALTKDITAPGLLSYVLPPFWGILIIIGATIALINDLPAMILSVSRLMFAWSKDNIFPEKISEIHPKFNTPHRAIIYVGIVASIGVFGSHFAGDFFLGIDIMVTSMMINFLLMCITLLTIKRVNPILYNNITIVKNRALQLLIGYLGSFIIFIFLVIHTFKDLSSNVDEWYFHSTYIYLIVMILASLYFMIRLNRVKTKNIDTFKELPLE
ncbi:APC family permease [Flavobacteriaceae bacterium]|nr:APC family permease [Flavobacteriaceae bacterium]